MSGFFTKQRLYVAGLTGLIGTACYGAIIYPMNHAKEYMAIQEETRKGLDREQIQPGGMRIWSNPFQERQKQEPLILQRANKSD